MICIGGRNTPGNLYISTNQHIAVTNCFYPNDDWYVNRPNGASDMKKVSAVYVGGEKVYPEPFPYRIRYRMRLDFTFRGNSHGYARPSTKYAESETVGFIEDTVLFETVFPMLIQTQPLPSPGSIYITAGSGKYAEPPWGKAEFCTDFSGTEYLLTPAAALTGPPPGTGSGYWSLGGSIYQQYSEKRISPGSTYPKAGYRYTLTRKVRSHKVNTVLQNWKDETAEYDTAYTVTARQTVSPYKASDSHLRGYYYDTASRHSEIRASESVNSNAFVTLGFVCRPPEYPGISGLYLLTDTAHYYGTNYVFWGAVSPSIYGYRQPGYLSPYYREGYSIKAPMFTGHKHFDFYDSSWDVGRRDSLSDWEDVDTRSHTDFDGYFEILYNNNPVFSSAEEYVKAFMG